VTTEVGWHWRAGSVEVALRVAERMTGRQPSPALRRAIEIVGRRGILVTGRQSTESTASPSVIKALIRRGILEDVPDRGKLPSAAVPSATFSSECMAELDAAARPVATLPLTEAVRGYLAALDARRAAVFERGSGGEPLRGQALAHLSAARQRLLDRAEAELRQALVGVDGAIAGARMPDVPQGNPTAP